MFTSTGYSEKSSIGNLLQIHNASLRLFLKQLVWCVPKLQAPTVSTSRRHLCNDHLPNGKVFNHRTGLDFSLMCNIKLKLDLHFISLKTVDDKISSKRNFYCIIDWTKTYNSAKTGCFRSNSPAFTVSHLHASRSTCSFCRTHSSSLVTVQRKSSNVAASCNHCMRAAGQNLSCTSSGTWPGCTSGNLD